MSSATQLAGGVIAHLVAIAIAGCYQPELRDCTVRCEQPTDCTGGQECRDDGWCAMPSVQSCAGDDSDGVVDARPIASDAPDLCQLGCPNGTCSDGVCVIDCSAARSCVDKDITCPPNLPCRVVCGERSCAKKVFCGSATSCEVRCNGDYSCQDEIVCNTNRCDVSCIGASSCKRTKCGHACACDVGCIGADACTDASDCPEATCRLGEGCSSLLAGCDRC